MKTSVKKPVVKYTKCPQCGSEVGTGFKETICWNCGNTILRVHEAVESWARKRGARKHKEYR